VTSWASDLGASIGYCLLWWPISFLAVKGSLQLTYRWRPFLLGYAGSVAALAFMLSAIHAFVPANLRDQPGDGARIFLDSFGEPFLLPIIASAFVAWSLRRKFSLSNPPKDQHNHQGKKTLLDQTLEISAAVIVSGYRQIASQHGCAPTAETSDQEVLAIYSKVGSAFQRVANQRREHLRAGIINRVVLKFLQVKEKMGDQFLDEHLSYELDKFQREGLRPEYTQDLHLI
jgi:hypothetical protein